MNDEYALDIGNKIKRIISQLLSEIPGNNTNICF